jgi:hypothetical protein
MAGIGKVAGAGERPHWGRKADIGPGRRQSRRVRGEREIERKIASKARLSVRLVGHADNRPARTAASLAVSACALTPAASVLHTPPPLSSTRSFSPPAHPECMPAHAPGHCPKKRQTPAHECDNWDNSTGLNPFRASHTAAEPAGPPRPSSRPGRQPQPPTACPLPPAPPRR